MAYYAKALATKPENSFSTKRIHEIRDVESEVRNPRSREMIAQLNEQKKEVILKTPEKLQELQKQLEADPLAETKKTQLMIKNLQRHLNTVYSYSTSLT